MRDPHVDSLKYRLQPDETWNYSNAPRLEGETADFRYVLANGTLTLHMNTHYGTVEEAKSSANEFLFLWELNSSLRFGQGAVRFVYEDAQIIERNPPPPGNLEVHMEGKTSFVARGELSMAAYPEPPSNMKFSPDLETLWIRYLAYKASREPLSGMAYFCLTVLEASAGGRSNAATKFNIDYIDYKVLGKIGKLTERRGDQRTARKMAVKLATHTPKEINWLEEAIKLIIRRVAEIPSGATCAKITMKDLPSL